MNFDESIGTHYPLCIADVTELSDDVLIPQPTQPEVCIWVHSLIPASKICKVQRPLEYHVRCYTIDLSPDCAFKQT